ncbi:MAG: lasso peptide biosynthesis B2 protein [Solirubrobacteraceae bacterium]
MPDALSQMELAGGPAGLGVKRQLLNLVLAIEIACTYAHVRILLRRHSLPATLDQLRTRTRFSRPLGRIRPDARRLEWAVMRTLRAVPSGSRCLMRSLVLLEVLARRGVRGDLVIAVQPSDSMGLDAHAWVEVDGRPMLPPEPSWSRLLTL